MQIRKEQIRAKLLEKGRDEFLIKGFEGASLRKIVKDSGTTIGNFYNYFENKEALFKELVHGEYQSFTYLIQHHQEVERPDFLFELTDVDQWRRVLGELISPMMPNLSLNFILLVEGSSGTEYEGTKEILIQVLADHFIEHMERLNPDHADKEFAFIIANQLLNGFIQIIKSTPNYESKKRLLCDYLLFFFIGSMGMIGDWKSYK